MLHVLTTSSLPFKTTEIGTPGRMSGRFSANAEIVFAGCFHDGEKVQWYFAALTASRDIAFESIESAPIKIRSVMLWRHETCKEETNLLLSFIRELSEHGSEIVCTDGLRYYSLPLPLKTLTPPQHSVVGGRPEEFVYKLAHIQRAEPTKDKLWEWRVVDSVSLPFPVLQDRIRPYNWALKMSRGVALASSNLWAESGQPAKRCSVIHYYDYTGQL